MDLCESEDANELEHLQETEKPLRLTGSLPRATYCEVSSLTFTDEEGNEIWTVKGEKLTLAGDK